MPKEPQTAPSFSLESVQPQFGTHVPFATARPCEAHQTHWSPPLYCELHHVVPQGWQKFWHPESAARDENGLYDPRTVALCRTGHGNVHYWLIAFMHYLKDHPDTDPPDVPRQVIHVSHHSRAEVQIALLAITRWQEVGGDVQRLIDAHLWGGMF